MNKIFEKQSLKSIINAINIGLVQYEKPESLIIKSDQVPDVFIKLIEIDVQEYVRKILVGNFAANNSQGHKPDFDKAETNFLSFVVFKKFQDEDKARVLGCMDLLELSIASELSGEVNKQDSEWSLDNNVWNLFTSEAPTELKEIDDEQLSEY